MKDGSDGGAFIEFRLLDSLRNPNSRVPKYAIIPTSSTQNSYVDYWFDNKEMIHQNVFCLTIANERFDGSLGATRGSWVVVYCSSHSGLDVDGVVCDEIVQIEETVAHEIGHRMGVVKKVGTAYSYVDELIDKGCHDDTDMCVMSYKNRNNGVAEFSIDALLGGSNGDRIDSLRGFPDR